MKKIAAIDIGTTKVCTIMGSIDANSNLRILGIGIVPSHGIEKALVADATKARDCIRESIRKAEVMAGHKLETAFVGVTGRHITSLNNRGTIAITSSDQLVRKDDFKRAMDVALNIKLTQEQKILHVIPRSYYLDGVEVKNPVGMNGAQLEVEMHIITANTAPVQNLIKCVKSIGIRIEDLVLEPLASAEAVLTEEEKQGGVLVVDIGGGTTDMAIIKNGSIFHTSVLPVAGHQITNDITAGLGLSYELAEEFKKKYANLQVPENEDPDKTLNENGMNIPYARFRDIIRARVEEIIRLVVLDLPRNEAAGLIPAGIVLTGGSSNLPGLVEMASDVTKLPVRLGMPLALEGVSKDTLNNPAYATSVGILLYAVKNKGTSQWFVKRGGFLGFIDQLLGVFR